MSEDVIILLVGGWLGLFIPLVIWDWPSGPMIPDDVAEKMYLEVLRDRCGKDAKPLGWWRDERGMLHGRWPPPGPTNEPHKGT